MTPPPSRSAEVGSCRGCKHFKLANECKSWESLEHAYGVCLVKLGGHVEFAIECGSYCQGGSVGEVTIYDVNFGCRAFEPKEPRP